MRDFLACPRYCFAQQNTLKVKDNVARRFMKENTEWSRRLDFAVKELVVVEIFTITFGNMLKI